ncbi:MAG: hypothetical protein H7175_13305 [Burkholderiales bacterium]|nr:hypothetical protein [Anaerolineae bacterium]
MAQLPEILDLVMMELRRRIDESWDADETMPSADALDSPLGHLVTAFGLCTRGNETHKRLTRLTIFAARRALPCWELYANNREPHQAIDAAQAWLLKGDEAYSLLELQKFSTPTAPSIHGAPLVGKQFTDTVLAGVAAAYAAELVMSADAITAAYGLSAADKAFDLSPIGKGRALYRQWLLDVAVPAAYAQRELTKEELGNPPAV